MAVSAQNLELGDISLCEGDVDPEENYVYHEISDDIDPPPGFVGIMMELQEVTQLNNICMSLWDEDRFTQYCYYIEVSTDKNNWSRVIDYSNYFCRSLQDLYFETCAVKYINIVGTYTGYTSSYNQFRLVDLRAYCRATVPRTINNFVCPEFNVATLEKRAIVEYGGGDACLDGTYANYNATEGYTTDSRICIQLVQPYMISHMKFLLLDCDEKSYNFRILTWPGFDQKCQMITDKSQGGWRSWQTFYFNERPVSTIHIHSTKENEPLRIVHFECMYKPPEEVDKLKSQEELPSFDSIVDYQSFSKSKVDDDLSHNTKALRLEQQSTHASP